MAKNEIIVLKRISRGHKNILTLVDYFETPNNLYLVTDIARGNELFYRIYQKGSFCESDAAIIVRSIVSGVEYLHSHNIVHRDLKPENLLFHTPAEDSDLVIADFGLSRIIDEERFRMLMTTCGTPGYMAPEVLRKSGHGKPVDLWAVGVICYFLLCGYTPFDRDTSFEELQAIVDCDYAFEPEEYWRDVTNDARDFISQCLQLDTEKRLTAAQCLLHPFLAKRKDKPKQEERGECDLREEIKEESMPFGPETAENNAQNADAAQSTIANLTKREPDLVPITLNSSLSLCGRITPNSTLDGVVHTPPAATAAVLSGAVSSTSSSQESPSLRSAYSVGTDAARSTRH